MKRCPRCQTMLTEINVGAVRVDGCGGCGGVWFDQAELGAVANAETTNLLALEDQFLPGPCADQPQAPMMCPSCSVPLFEFEYPHSPGVRLDACPQCKGTWADNGELKAIYVRLTGIQHREDTADVDARRSGRQAVGLLQSRPCPHCRRNNASAARSCLGCGRELPHAVTPVCPNCDVALSRLSFQGLSLEVCPDCTGVWLDAGELSALADCTPEQLRQVQNDSAAKRQGVSALWNANPSLMCPKCSVSLAAPDLVYGADVPLDACLHCNGVWVGAGNMASISRHYRKSLGRRAPL